MAGDFKPAGSQQVIPYLLITEPAKTIAFLKHVFGATEAHVSRTPDGKVIHASMKVGDSLLMMGQAAGQNPPMPAMVYVYVPDVDACYQRALELGAKSVRAVEDQFYGDRSGGVADDQGTQWWMGTHIEDLSEEELQRRTQAAFAKATNSKA